MDIGKSFSFVFDDQGWAAKIIIGGVISIIPVIGWLFVIGYMIAVSRNAIRGNSQVLPDWSDFGQLFIDGIFAAIIGFVYVLPIFVVMCIVLLPGLALGGGFENDGELDAIGVLASCFFSAFAITYSVLVGWLFIPAALARYADTGEMMDGLRFGEVWAITRANPGAFLVALLVSWVAGLLASLGLILCCIGVIFTAFYAQCVTGHAYGKAYLAAKERVAA